MDVRVKNISRMEALLRSNRRHHRRSLAVYLNCGDPTLELTRTFILQCAAHGIDVIELGVPFPNSFTDGEVVLRSHDRALGNGVVFEDALQLVESVRGECSTPIVMLTDFGHTVKARGISQVMRQSRQCGADGLLLHGLPPLFLDQYLEQADDNGLDPILSLYPSTPPARMALTLKHAQGFVYLVTQYGKSGTPVDLGCEAIIGFFNKVRKATDLPLMAGFGIKNIDDLQRVFSSSAIDGAIVGSAFCTLIEAAVADTARLLQATDNYLQSITQAKEMTYENRR